jgi:protein tyrosine phosphatase (PTP) superfamily phosphohydrolase (DUF442 family)
MGVHKYCRSTTECSTHVKCRAECIQGCPQVLQINNRMFNPCEVQSIIHPGVSTSIADQQQNVQPMWSIEQNTSRGVHKYCRSTTECSAHVKYRAECIQECPQVLQINNRMFNPCEVQSRMHPGVSTSIADQQQNVQPMWSTEQNASRGVHKYCRSTTECSTHVKYRAEYIQGCPQVLQINKKNPNKCVTSNYLSSWIHVKYMSPRIIRLSEFIYSACHLELFVFLNSYIVHVTSNYSSSWIHF